MQKDYERLFAHIEDKEPPEGLLVKILLRIEEERRRRALRGRILIFGILSFAAAGALVPAWNELQSEISQSGFLQFTSLFFSDFTVLMAYWKEFAFSLLESLPFLGAVSVLGTILAFFSFMRLLIRNINIMHAPSALAKVNN